MNKKVLRTIGMITLIIGALSFFIIGVLSIWGDIEASFFNNTLQSSERLTTLKCPSVIMKDEIATISANFHNPTDKPIELEIRTYITDGFVTLMTEYITDVPLQPEETKIVKWPISSDDAAYDRVVMARVHMMKEYPLPYRDAACGVVVVNLPFIDSGRAFVTLVLSLGGVFSVGGILLWSLNSKPLVPLAWRRFRIFKAQIFVAVTALAVALSGLSGLWFLGVLFTMVFLLMGAEMLRQFLSPQPIKESQ